MEGLTLAEGPPRLTVDDSVQPVSGQTAYTVDNMHLTVPNPFVKENFAPAKTQRNDQVTTFMNPPYVSSKQHKQTAHGSFSK
jgi:hypothetical protein